MKSQRYSPGLEGVIAGETALCQVDEGEAGLRYRGYAIEDLANEASFEEVAYLLLIGALPARKELDDFSAQLRVHWVLPGPIEAFLGVLPPRAHPMDVLRTSISLLGMTDPEGNDGSHEANVRKAIRLLAQIPVILGAAHRLSHGKRQIQPRPELSFAENVLYLLTERQGDRLAKTMARTLEVSLVLYAEHEFNASTFAARVAASTLTDLHAAITAAVATLKGPLHGGANEAVAAMLQAIKTPERADPWVRKALASQRRIMGFGHRVLKRGDVRSQIIQRFAEDLSRTCHQTHWYEIATRIDRVMEQEKGLRPNLDFYTAVGYLLMDIPQDLYTPLFVCARMAGWCAHVIEQQDHNRLIRPRALYAGPPRQAYVSLDRRG